jgi:ABC-type Fe3+-siderophore transport system permease subunit
MNKHKYPYWIRFCFFFLVFAAAFFLIIFIVDKNPFGDMKMLLIKISVLATLSSALYNILLESDPETVD